MIQQEEHYGHEGWCVFESLRSKKRWFIFRDELGFGGGVKKEATIIQVLRPKTKRIKTEEGYQTEYNMDEWHFAKHYTKGKGGKLERVIWPPCMNREITQALINVSGKETETENKDRDLAEYGI